MPFVSGRSSASSSSYHIDAHQEGPQSPSPGSSCHPKPTHATSSACSHGQAVRIVFSETLEDPLLQDLSARHNYMSSTQALLNVYPSGGAVQTRQARPVSMESTLADSKRRKLGGQPYVAPSKLALKFPRLKQHPKGDG